MLFSFLTFPFSKKITFIYLFWLCPVLVTAYVIFHCVTRTLYLVPWPEIEPGPPALATGSLSHWITREATFPYAYVAGSGFILRWPASRSPGGCHTRRQQVSTRLSVDAGEEGCEGGKRRSPHACLLHLQRNTFPGGRSAYISLGRRGLMASLPEPQKWLAKEGSRFFGICIWRWARRGGEPLTKAFAATNQLPLFLSLASTLFTDSSIWRQPPRLGNRHGESYNGGCWHFLLSLEELGSQVGYTKGDQLLCVGERSRFV